MEWCRNFNRRLNGLGLSGIREEEREARVRRWEGHKEVGVGRLSRSRLNMLGGPRRRWFPLCLEELLPYNFKVPEDAGAAQDLIDSMTGGNRVIQAFSDREWEDKGTVRGLSFSK